MIDLNIVDADVLDKLAADVRAQADEGLEHLGIDRLIALSPWSRRQTERLFRERFLTSPARFFRDCQSDCALERLIAGDDVLTASTRAGFASLGRLHDAVIARSGMTPGELRRRGEGVHIDFGFFETQIGVVLIAATRRGLSSLRLCGANPTTETLCAEVAELRADYSDADLDENSAVLQSYADQLVAYLSARSPTFCPSLDILQGTTFQREVWAELQKVEPGETVTYSEIARRIGHPSAVRAVANACAHNELAIAIPCHRAVRQDGTLAGYRWGIEWKQRLLAIEAERGQRYGFAPLVALDESRAEMALA